jgi:hypothetical protein
VKAYHRRWVDPRHQYRRWIDSRLRTLRVADVTNYLRARGWQPMPTDRHGFLIFQEPPGSDADGGPYYQFLPDSEDGEDFALCMFDFLTGLAEFENRQASEVIDDILHHAGRAGGNGPTFDPATSQATTNS